MPRSLEPREKRTIALGGIAAAAILTYVLWPPDTLNSDVELVQPATPTQTPPAVPAPVAPPPVIQAPAAPSVEGLRLFGLMGGGAIIGQGEGAQRFVALGRDVQPGLTLIAIEQHAAVLRSASGDIRIGFAGPVQTPVATAAAAVPAGQQAGLAANNRALLSLGEALTPRPAGGYTVKPGASVPILTQAGVRPGDTILSVNGSPMDEQRLMKLAEWVAEGANLRFEVERAGRRINLGQ